MRSPQLPKVLNQGKLIPGTYYLETGALKEPSRAYYLDTWGARELESSGSVTRLSALPEPSSSRGAGAACPFQDQGPDPQRVQVPYCLK